MSEWDQTTSDHQTSMEQKIINAIRNHTNEHRYPPSLEDLAYMVGLKSKSAVLRHVDRLVEKGMVAKEPGQARTIRLIEGNTQ